jgi:hypothetical protein
MSWIAVSLISPFFPDFRLICPSDIAITTDRISRRIPPIRPPAFHSHPRSCSDTITMCTLPDSNDRDTEPYEQYARACHGTRVYGNGCLPGENGARIDTKTPVTLFTTIPRNVGSNIQSDSNPFQSKVDRTRAVTHHPATDYLRWLTSIFRVFTCSDETIEGGGYEEP